MNTLEILNNTEFKLYELFYERLILSWKPFEITKYPNYTEISYYQDRKYDLMVSEDVDSSDMPVLIKNAPDWSCRLYSLHEIENVLVFVRAESGEYKIPKAFTEEQVSAVLKRKAYLISQQDYNELYA